MGVLSAHTVDFLEFFPGNRNHPQVSDDEGCHELQLVCHCEVGHCEIEDEDAACGFPLKLSVAPPSSFPIDIAIEVFSSESLILSLTLMFWTCRSKRLPRFRQVSILHSKALHRKIFWFHCLISNFSFAQSVPGLSESSEESSAESSDEMLSNSVHKSAKARWILS